MSEPRKPPAWQTAIGVVIGTAVGGVIYGIFLQALLIQSLLIDRRPLDPAEWREKLSGRAWICGALSFLSIILVPFKFLRREAGATVLRDTGEAAVAWCLVGMILVIQIATVCYAVMRKELCSVEHPTELFEYLFWGRRRPLQPVPDRVEVLHIQQNPLQPDIVVTSEWSAAEPRRSTRSPLLRCSWSIGLWKNWIQIAILVLEFVQLFSMALDGGRALEAAGVQLIPVSVLDSLGSMRNVLWQFGMSVENTGSFWSGFGVLVGFGGLYIFLCGVFIALELTVDSWLAPFHFTLLAGGFYGSITSGLLFLILYSTEPAHLVVCLLMLAYYSSTAVFVSIYRSDLKKAVPGEIRTVPVFVAIERVSKGVLAACSVAIQPANQQAKPAVLMVFGLYLAALTLYLRPYSVRGITALRLTSLLVCSWTALLVLIASFVSTAVYGSVFTTGLVAGWCAIPLSAVVILRLR